MSFVFVHTLPTPFLQRRRFTRRLDAGLASPSTILFKSSFAATSHPTVQDTLVQSRHIVWLSGTAHGLVTGHTGMRVQ